MQFLSKFLNWLKKSPKGSRQTPVSVGGVVARFVFDKRHVFAKTGMPKPAAFTPENHPTTGKLETSVCALNEMSGDRLCYLGHTIRANKKMFAVCDLPLSGIFSAGLECMSAPDHAHNFPEHAVIVGWREGDDGKEKRLEAMQELAASVTLVRRSNDGITLV